jgi:hypothetical protein
MSALTTWHQCKCNSGLQHPKTLQATCAAPTQVCPCIYDGKGKGQMWGCAQARSRTACMHHCGHPGGRWTPADGGLAGTTAGATLQGSTRACLRNGRRTVRRETHRGGRGAVSTQGPAKDLSAMLCCESHVEKWCVNRRLLTPRGRRDSAVAVSAVPHAHTRHNTTCQCHNP